MVELGFDIDGKYYILPNSKFFIEILTPPVTVGDEFVQNFASRDTKLGTLKLLTPTDCVKDRLCGCFLHDDKHCFEHAMAVASKNEIDIANLRNWANNEDKSIKKGVEYFIFSLEVLNNPTKNNIIKYLTEFCKKNYIDIDDDLGQQDLIDDLSYTFLGKELFSKYSKNELIQLIQNKK